MNNKNQTEQCTALHDCVLDNLIYSRTHFVGVSSIMRDDFSQNAEPKEALKAPTDITQYFTPLRVIENPGRYLRDYNFYQQRLSEETIRQDNEDQKEFIRIVRGCQASVGVPSF